MSTNPLITSTGLRMLAASIILITASPAFAQFQKPEDAIKYRQSAFSLIGLRSFKNLKMQSNTVKAHSA